MSPRHIRVMTILGLAMNFDEPIPNVYHETGINFTHKNLNRHIETVHVFTCERCTKYFK